MRGQRRHGNLGGRVSSEAHPKGGSWEEIVVVCPQEETGIANTFQTVTESEWSDNRYTKCKRHGELSILL